MPSPMILTNIGLAKLASATPEDQLEVKHIAVGDGGGGYPPIDPTMTALANEVWRGDSSAPIRDSISNRVLIFETIIPSNEGGFTIREVGLFDVDGDMIAIGQVDEIDKTDGAPGSTPLTLTLRVRLTLENASQTDLIIADSPIVDHQGTSNRDAADAHPIEAITGLEGALNAKANTADLGPAAYKDVVSGEDDTTSGRLITTEWRGLDLTRNWDCGPGSTKASWGAWCKIATVSSNFVGEIRVTGFENVLFADSPSSARISISQHTSLGSAPIFVSTVSRIPSDAELGKIYSAPNPELSNSFDVYFKVGWGSRPICSAIINSGYYLTPRYEEYFASLPVDAVEGVYATEWNSLSMAQTWQDMTASRALDTTYTNNTGRPIHVSVNLNPDTGATAPYAALNVDGMPIAQSKASSAAGQVYLNVYSIVPPGSTYTLVTATGTGAAVIRWWREYR